MHLLTENPASYWGYRWNSREDFLGPGLGELNFNKKIRGAKAPNLSPIVTREDAENMMKDVVLTRQAVTARIAEFYDPSGLMEPIKLQLKLLLTRLNGKDWKTPLTSEEQVF